MIESIEEALALDAIHWLRSEVLPEVALLFVERNASSSAMAALAGATRADSVRDLRDLFDEALAELAFKLRALFAARGALSTDAAVQQATRIVELFREVEPLLPSTTHYVGDNFGISDLVGWYYALGDVEPNDASAVEECQRGLQLECKRIAEAGDL
jgi:hypothetical protein